MIGKILSHLLGNVGEDFEAADNTYEELMEFEDGGWVIINLPGENSNVLCSVRIALITGMKTDLFEFGCSLCRERVALGP